MNAVICARFSSDRQREANKEFDDSDELVGTLTEASTGAYEMDGVEYGGYFVKERTAPENFYLAFMECFIAFFNQNGFCRQFLGVQKLFPLKCYQRKP